jgi:APA family basic amino acid/polyamine antiporter
VITGFIFYLTAATYAEATAMYPEAGGSSSFARQRVQRVLVVLRRVGADAQLHDHDRHLGVLRAALLGGAVRRDALRHAPGDIVFGIGVVVVLALVNVVGVQESAA